MARMRMAATRSNLLMIKERLRLAREGYRLLDRKRGVLILEILRLLEGTEKVQAKVEEQFRLAYGIVQEARSTMGTERVMRFALSRPEEVDVRITPRSIMGVVVPTIRYNLPERELPYGFGDTSPVLDQAQREWGAVLSSMAELSESVATVWRLAPELRRTQRRLNALEHVFIPMYEETLHYIEDTLEEREREDLFRMKRAKARLEAARETEGSGEALN